MEQSDLLSFTIDQLENLGITYMLVGSIASGTYGQPRLTHDIDIVVDADAQQIRALCAQFPPADFYVSVDAALQSLVMPNGQFNIIHPESGNKIDFMIARRDPWGREQIARRARELILPGKEGYAARPEDIILSKLLYYQEGGSEKHLRDISGILRVSGEKVDKAYVAQWSATLGVAEIWDGVLKRVL